MEFSKPNLFSWNPRDIAGNSHPGRSPTPLTPLNASTPFLSILAACLPISLFPKTALILKQLELLENTSLNQSQNLRLIYEASFGIWRKSLISLTHGNPSNKRMPVISPWNILSSSLITSYDNIYPLSVCMYVCVYAYIYRYRLDIYNHLITSHFQ